MADMASLGSSRRRLTDVFSADDVRQRPTQDSPHQSFRFPRGVHPRRNDSLPLRKRSARLPSPRSARASDDERAPFPSDAALSLCAKMAQATSADARRVPSSKRGVPRGRCRELVGRSASGGSWRRVRSSGTRAGAPRLPVSGTAAFRSRPGARQPRTRAPGQRCRTVPGGTRRRRPRSECATRSGQHVE
jgi:hypothetical protein